MARVLLGVTGGIAAYKALEFTRLAMKAGHSVRVIQTEASVRFVGPASFAGITGAPVLLGEWETDPLRGAFPGDPLPEHAPLSHLQLVANADVFLIAPASANTIAKLAHGHADNLLSTAALACRRPLLVAPAMNNEMYDHPATQANLALLRERGATVLQPGVGALGSIGEYGVGRLPEPAELLAAVDGALGTPGGGDLDGLRVLVTAGGTREPIDSVRYVGNRSSGRMGFALAEEAARRGASVTVIAANVGLPRAAGIDYVDVETAAQVHDAALEHFPAADMLFMAAAVADYRPAVTHDSKLKKDAIGAELALPLERTEDVLSKLASIRRPDQVLVGFAAEHGEGAVAYGREKLARKNLDLVVVNDISRADIGFDTRENEVTLVTPDDEQLVPKAPKNAIARAILQSALSHRSSSQVKVR
jgi:phosphopantothenoylcysteine decarboxylase/phosphopantothenate--cysteine ligase